MKRLLSTTTLFAALMTSAALVSAGPGGCGGGGPGAGMHGMHGGMFGGMDMVSHLERVIDLTEEQKTALQEITAQMQPMTPAPMPGRSLSALDATAADYQEQVTALAEEAAEAARARVLQHGEFHAKVQALLTEEQKAALQAFRETRQSRRDMRMGGGY